MATLDVLSETEARRAVKVADSSYDDRLSSLVTAVSTRFDELCGPIVQRTVTAERHDGGCTTIFPRMAPVAAWTTVTEYQGTTATTLTAESPGSAPANGYLWQSTTGELVRRSSGYPALFASTFVVLTYTAGRFATTGAVESRFKEAVSITLAHIWRTESGSGNQTFGADSEFRFSSFSVPNRAMELVAHDRRVPGFA